MLSGQKNSKKQGDAGLGAAIAWFTMRGYTVSVPLTDSQDYDLVVEIEGQLRRVQVKTTTHQRNGKYVATLKVSGGNKSGTGATKTFDQEAVDFVFILTEDSSKYLIPSVSIEGKYAISLCEKYEKFAV